MFSPNFSDLIFKEVNFWGFWGPAEMCRNDFEEKKVISVIFKQFWNWSHLILLDSLTPQDVYWISCHEKSLWWTHNYQPVPNTLLYHSQESLKQFIYENMVNDPWIYCFSQSLSFLRRPQKLTKSLPLIWHYVVNAKSTVKILSVCVAFFENMNFTSRQRNCHKKAK